MGKKIEVSVCAPRGSGAALAAFAAAAAVGGSWMAKDLLSMAPPNWRNGAEVLAWAWDAAKRADARWSPGTPKPRGMEARINPGEIILFWRSSNHEISASFHLASGVSRCQVVAEKTSTEEDEYDLAISAERQATGEQPSNAWLLENVSRLLSYRQIAALQAEAFFEAAEEAKEAAKEMARELEEIMHIETLESLGVHL